MLSNCTNQIRMEAYKAKQRENTEFLTMGFHAGNSESATGCAVRRYEERLSPLELTLRKPGSPIFSHPCGDFPTFLGRHELPPTALSYRNVPIRL